MLAASKSRGSRKGKPPRFRLAHAAMCPPCFAFSAACVRETPAAIAVRFPPFVPVACSRKPAASVVLGFRHRLKVCRVDTQLRCATAFAYVVNHKPAGDGTVGESIRDAVSQLTPKAPILPSARAGPKPTRICFVDLRPKLFSAAPHCPDSTSA